MDTTRHSLLIRIRDRADRAAWSEFDGLYRPMLLRIARSRGLGEADAEDVTQHCLTAVQQHIQEFDYDPRKGRFKGWLRTLVNNRIRNLLRAWREQEAKTGDFEREQQREPTPEDAFDTEWMQAHLRHCLKDMRNEVDRASFDAFRRHVIEERTVAQVCEEFNLLPNQLYKIKWRLMQTLRERMHYLQGDGEE